MIRTPIRGAIDAVVNPVNMYQPSPSRLIYFIGEPKGFRLSNSARFPFDDQHYRTVAHLFHFTPAGRLRSPVRCTDCPPT